jgi:hypothetical protein
MGNWTYNSLETPEAARNKLADELAELAERHDLDALAHILEWLGSRPTSWDRSGNGEPQAYRDVGRRSETSNCRFARADDVERTPRLFWPPPERELIAHTADPIYDACVATQRGMARGKS